MDNRKIYTIGYMLGDNVKDTIFTKRYKTYNRYKDFIEKIIRLGLRENGIDGPAAFDIRLITPNLRGLPRLVEQRMSNLESLDYAYVCPAWRPEPVINTVEFMRQHIEKAPRARDVAKFVLNPEPARIIYRG